MQLNLIIAGTYAKSIFDIAIKYKSIEKWKESLIQLLYISKIKDVNQFFTSIYPTNVILQVILYFYTNDIDVYIKNFIQLLIMHQRLGLIKSIYQKFNKLYNEYYNIIDVELTVPYKLNIQKKKKIAILLSNKLNKKINLICKIDNSMLYGIIIRYNNMIIDNCVMSFFNKLSNSLIL